MNASNKKLSLSFRIFPAQTYITTNKTVGWIVSDNQIVGVLKDAGGGIGIRQSLARPNPHPRIKQAFQHCLNVMYSDIEKATDAFVQAAG